MALMHRLDLANTRDSLEDTLRKLELAAKGLGIQLNLVGTANVNAERETRWENLQFDEGVYTLGLEADLPLDRKTERNIYREALISLQQDRRTYDEEVDRIKLAVRPG